jgi:hypothetical protein
MTTVEKLIPVIRENSQALIELMDNADPTNVEWFLEVGTRLNALSKIHSGEYTGEGIAVTSQVVYLGKRTWLKNAKEVIKQTFNRLF